MAIKRLLRDEIEIAENELALLLKCDIHPNVIRYFCEEEYKNYIYIALELCNATLDEYVTGKFEIGRKLIEPETVLKDVTAGLEFLHSKKISMTIYISVI